jgi:hypothetical protein
MYRPGIEGSSFTLAHTPHSLGTAFHLSAGDIATLTFGDIIPRAGIDRALTDLETVLGLLTFTLALGYVVTAFDALGNLENLHGRVRRHAEQPERPSSILTRHFRGGEPSDLPSFLQALGEDLEDYDQGLRRYPVVYFFHTRRTERSIPKVFSAIGDLIALLRWGLPPDEPITKDPFLVALHDAYLQTVDRLRRNFVGPDPIAAPEPLSRDEFLRSYGAEGDGDPTVRSFRELERHGFEAADADFTGDGDEAYERYREWLPFAHEQRVVLSRVADRLGYERPRPLAPA